MAAAFATLTCWTASCSILGGGVEPEQFSPVTTISGLVVQDLVRLEGPGVGLGSEVTVHYSGRLANGEVFDSSYQTGVPITFVLGAGQVPAGLEEGIVGMVRGGRRLLTLPPELAYGADGVPDRVPANAEVSFGVELLDVLP